MIVGHQEGPKKRTLRDSPAANTWSESRRRPCEPLRTGSPSNAGLLMASPDSLILGGAPFVGGLLR